MLTFEILPKWDGNPVAAFRVDQKDITLGESVTLTLEMISTEKRKDKAWIDSPEFLGLESN
ncbi:MAG: hypothetical protein PF795_03345 [Kiritimatiellae bacterium]|nr:hypothetical protein [Kiritimatiellia bacterium]